MEAIGREGEPREFSFRINKLEAAFDFLNSIVNQGDTLLKVFLLDDNKVTNLPVEAFEGFPFTNIIEELESEWIAILGNHSPNSINNQQLVTGIKRLANIYTKRISNLELVITRMSQLLERAEIHNAPFSPLNTHYRSILSQYSAQLIQNNVIRYRLLNLL